jgi:hypothetical protein
MRRFSHPKPLKNKAGCWPFFAYLRRQNYTFFLRFWCHFPSRGHPWSILGSFGVPLGAQDRILIDFRLILGPLLDPSRPQLGGLGASFGVLGRSFGGLEPFYLRSYFQVFFGLHFASISDPRTTPKSFKNQLIIRVKIKLRKRLISTPFPSKFQENVMLKTKTSIYQKCAKTCSFC